MRDTIAVDIGRIVLHPNPLFFLARELFLRSDMHPLDSGRQ